MGDTAPPLEKKSEADGVVGIVPGSVSEFNIKIDPPLKEVCEGVDGVDIADTVTPLGVGGTTGTVEPISLLPGESV